MSSTGKGWKSASRKFFLCLFACGIDIIPSLSSLKVASKHSKKPISWWVHIPHTFPLNCVDVSNHLSKSHPKQSEDGTSVLVSHDKKKSQDLQDSAGLSFVYCWLKNSFYVDFRAKEIDFESAIKWLTYPKCCRRCQTIKLVSFPRIQLIVSIAPLVTSFGGDFRQCENTVPSTKNQWLLFFAQFWLRIRIHCSVGWFF